MCVRLEHFSKNYTQEYRAWIEDKHETHYNTQTRLAYTASEKKHNQGNQQLLL
jgi:L,D-peptidoglycan transpeptidase YkuD (ErfK/YbiS/YcfS/YnhG family)